jgi:ACDE family multidrug resistance protein
MGIGLVDPILPAIATNLEASPSEVSLLFTSYFLVTAVAMLITGFVSSRIGGKKTLLIGLAVIVVFSSLSGLSGSVGELVGFRAGWGLGNALFVATALAVIVGVASGGAGTAIILYEAALGLGISLGPLLGALLGGWQWRAPFFGTAALMAAAFVALIVLLPRTPLPERKVRLRDPLLALGHKGLRTTAVSGLFYNYGFFTILAFTPFILGMDAYGIGGVFFGWGVAVAVFSVFVAPVLQNRFGATKVLAGTLLALMLTLLGLGLAAGHSVAAVVVLVVVSGALLGINNTIYTELAMGVSDSAPAGGLLRLQLRAVDGRRPGPVRCRPAGRALWPAGPVLRRGGGDGGGRRRCPGRPEVPGGARAARRVTVAHPENSKPSFTTSDGGFAV